MQARPIHRSFDLCPHCDEFLKEDKTINVGSCFDCGRQCCDCWLERVNVEGEVERKLWCLPGAPGGCEKEEVRDHA